MSHRRSAMVSFDWCRFFLLCGVLLLQRSTVAAFHSFTGSAGCRRSRRTSSTHHHHVGLLFGSAMSRSTRATSVLLQAAKKDNDDDDKIQQPGMEEAFRQLEALESLGDVSSDAAPSPSVAQKKLSTPDDMTLLPTDSPPLETEIRVYEDMVGELAMNQDAEAYSEMIADMGSAPKQTNDTYSQVLDELGGRPASLSKKNEESTIPSSMGLVVDEETTLQAGNTEQFLEEALQEALEDVKVRNPDILSDSILDDKEIMKEIEKIFEEGNEKLLSSLEDIRKEQLALSTESANRNAQKASDSTDVTAQRLQSAETSMRKVLGKVETEREQVERAVRELEQANQDVENNILYQLKQGGIPKQGALVGFVLFAGRSIVDSIAAVSGNDETMLTSALIQAVVAIVCAVVFFVI